MVLSDTEFLAFPARGPGVGIVSMARLGSRPMAFARHGFGSGSGSRSRVLWDKFFLAAPASCGGFTMNGKPFSFAESRSHRFQFETQLIEARLSERSRN